MRQRAVVDAVTVVSAMATGVLLMFGPTAPLRPYGPAGVVVACALAVPLWWRRRAPGPVAWMSAAVGGALVVAEVVAPGSVLRPDVAPTTALAAPTAPFAAYAVAVYAGRRWAAWIAVVAMVVLAASHLTAGRIRPALLLIGIPTLLGLYVGARRRLVDALRDRADRAERERDLRAAEAVARERARLTAEMHDVVSHRVSLIVLEAGALGLTTADTSTVAAAERIRAAGCQALDELRDLVRVLPEPDTHEDPLEPLPDLAPLLAEARSAGTRVGVVEHGAPVLVAPVVGRTVYRLVQEGLTNVRKHAPGAPVRLRLAHDERGIGVSIRSGSAAVSPDRALVVSGSGAGLLGLRRRIELIGGSFTAGRCADGGFEVSARLPRSPDR